MANKVAARKTSWPVHIVAGIDLRPTGINPEAIGASNVASAATAEPRHPALNAA